MHGYFGESRTYPRLTRHRPACDIWTSTPIHFFMICYKIAIHCVCKLWTATIWFFTNLDMSLPPGGQIQKSIRLKCCTQIEFIICHKFAIHCACKLWKGMMLFRFFQFLDISMPPGGQIHKSILLKFHYLLQDCNVSGFIVSRPTQIPGHSRPSWKIFKAIF